MPIIPTNANPAECIHCGAPAPSYPHKVGCILRTDLDRETDSEGI